MTVRREPSHPPSEPQLARARALAFGGDDRPGRVQLGIALVAGIVLVAAGLYLWRRPRASEAGDEPATVASAAAALGDAGLIVGAPGVDAGPPSSVALSEPRVLGCQDRGSGKTAPDACDRLAPVEKALADAIHQASTCVATDAGGTIEYVADVSFLRHKVNVSLPRAGRSVRDHKALRSCSSAVRGALQGLALDGIDHQHARYKIAVTATYAVAQPGTGAPSGAGAPPSRGSAPGG